MVVLHQPGSVPFAIQRGTGLLISIVRDEHLYTGNLQASTDSVNFRVREWEYVWLNFDPRKWIELCGGLKLTELS